MDYIQLLQKRINSISENAIERDIFDEFFKLEKVIVDMQQNQISQHQGFDDRKLERFSGEDSKYKYTTQWYADNNIPYPSLTSKHRILRCSVQQNEWSWTYSAQCFLLFS